MRVAAQATQSLIQAQLQLAAAVAGGSSSSSSTEAHKQQQQQYSLGLIWPCQQLRQAVEQLARQPLLDLFSQQQQQSVSSDKTYRALQLANLQRQLLADLRRMGLMADDQTALTAAAAAGLYSREDVLRSFDTLQSTVMRELLLQVRGARSVKQMLLFTLGFCTARHRLQE